MPGVGGTPAYLLRRSRRPSAQTPALLGAGPSPASQGRFAQLRARYLRPPPSLRTNRIIFSRQNTQYHVSLHRNYGLLPQTWEDPGHKQADLGGIAVGGGRQIGRSQAHSGVGLSMRVPARLRAAGWRRHVWCAGRLACSPRAAAVVLRRVCASLRVRLCVRACARVRLHTCASPMK